MSGIIRTWHCLNSACGKTFDSWEPNPLCPACKCVRVGWVPNGGYIKGAATKTGDAELRALADVFRMGDMNSAQAGQAAKKVSLPPPAQGGAVHTFANGFSAAINPAAGAQCVPTSNKVDFKVGAKLGERLSPNSSFPGMSSNTVIEGIHKATR